MSARAGSFSEYMFPGGANPGGYESSSGVVIDTNGNLWGTTSHGGTGASWVHDEGTIFRLVPPAPGQQDWGGGTKFNFSPDPNHGGFYTDGSSPLGLTYDGLDNPTQGGAGHPKDLVSPVYGWTGGGGKNADGRGVLFSYGGGCGFHILHRFTDISGGYDPVGLTIGSDGALYGVIATGPDVQNDSGGVFRITPTSDSCGPTSYRIIYRFTNGHIPTGGMTFGPDGTLYLSATGGSAEILGEILKLKQSPTHPSVWYPSVANSYSESNHGFAGHMAFGTDGALYVADPGNGDTVPGRIYRLHKKYVNGKMVWLRDTLYSFAEGDTEGNNPTGVFFGPDGVLYGTTSDNRGGGYGTVFKVTPQPDNPGALPWNMTVLHAFAGTDGSRPTGTLAFGSNGAIYGATVFGSPDYPTDYIHGYAFELVP